MVDVAGDLGELLTQDADPERRPAEHVRLGGPGALLDDPRQLGKTLHAPVNDLHSNWAYMLIAALAWNIKSWHAMMMHRKDNRHAFIRMEFKRFLDTVVRIPAMVLVRARAIVVRLVAFTVNVDRFFSAWATTERIHFSPGTG